MSKFDSHFRMTPKDSIEYVLEKLPDYFDAEANLSSKEIGDGNINYVFRVEDSKTGKSIIVKHGDIYFRNSDEEADLDRSRIEAKILKIEHDMAPQMVPELYLYDPVMCCICMEDVGDHENMWYGLRDHKTYPQFAEDITTFLANSLILTTDSVLSPEKKKEYQKEFINPEMCGITESLVLTDPYMENCETNEVFPLNEIFVQETIFRDECLRLEVAKLKEVFKSKAQSLIHGDLHCGSIFVKSDSTKVLDPEFAFYGPAGYDVGNVLAHLFFAWVNAQVTLPDGPLKQQFQLWVQETIIQVVDLFYQKAKVLLTEEATDAMAKTEGFAEWFLRDILADTAGYTGTELIRRIVGEAKVRLINLIDDAEQKALAERICLQLGKSLIMNRFNMNDGKSYLEWLNRAVSEVTNEG